MPKFSEEQLKAILKQPGYAVSEENFYAEEKPVQDLDIRFDSEEEKRRHNVLTNWQAAGLISNLQLKPKFTLMDGFYHPSKKTKVRGRTWEADWSYQQEAEPWFYVIEDYKGGYRYKNFQEKLSWIYFELAEEHVFINEEITGWYRPFREGNGGVKVQTKNGTIIVNEKFKHLLEEE